MLGCVQNTDQPFFHVCKHTAKEAAALSIADPNQGMKENASVS